MDYYVIEIQVSKDGTSTGLMDKYEDKDHALSKYHDVLRYASVSELPKHGAVVLDEEGRLIVRECYMHVTPLEELE